ncbi:hypothetical protein [Nostoc sp. TCL26-01]|uniref:hypothetical protein n=1 Tax=Nostoc sp. TCL26-01 TaxID=2576904 RepID=UPI0015B97A82|nr:hypothetical protein [Nostoc sp. TCL26-01]QLE57934.1 hypothetical protein FD725_21910 [Nostoc sp. TCL26-01]
MLTQMTTNDLMMDLSAEQQQLLAGGRLSEDTGTSDDDDDNFSSSDTSSTGVRRYRIRSFAIVSVRKLS